jgi:putative SbcD/Mre11-related phosphoesterase
MKHAIKLITYIKYMQPLVDERALMHKDTLAVADLHLGFEYELAKSGINLPSYTRQKLEKINEIIEKTKAKRLIILGDLKHQIPFPSGMEELEVREFIDQLKPKIHVEIVKGNHDGNLDFLNVPIYPPSGVVIDGVGYFHGNAWPDKTLLSGKYLVMGHTHPQIVFEDKLGHRSKLPCWLRVKIDPEKCRDRFGMESRSELIIMPAFSELAGGHPVNLGQKILGPILKVTKLNEAQIYLLDGTHLGNLEDLKLRDKKAFNTRKKKKA